MGSGLFDFDERAGKVLRMEEQHRLAMSADLRHAVAEDARALADQLVARRDDVGHVIADVMDAAVGVALDEFGDRRSLAERLDELDLGVGQRHEHGDDAMLRQRHRAGDFSAERAAMDFCGLFRILDRDRNVIEPAQHDTPLPASSAPSRYEPGSVRSKTLSTSNRQNMNEANRLLAPMLVDDGTHRAAYRFRHRVGIAPPRPRQALDGRYHDVEDNIVDHLSRRILFRDADQI